MNLIVKELKMKKIILLMLIILSASFSVTILADAAVEKGLKIANDGDSYDQGFADFTANMVMTLRNRKGDESSRKIRMKTLETESDGDKSMSIFDEPADVKGTAMLTFSHGLEADDQWLYLPALKRVKRISSKNKSGSFMGSEFAFEDLGSQEVEKYTYKYIKEEACGDWQCNVIERKPAYKYSGYTRQMVWSDKEKYRIVKVDYYDRKNSLLKTLVMTDYNEYLGHYWRPGRMVMENHQNKKSTTLEWTNYQFKTGLEEKDFNSNKLKSIR